MTVTMPSSELILHKANQCTKFQVSSLSHSKDILGRQEI